MRKCFFAAVMLVFASLLLGQSCVSPPAPPVPEEPVVEPPATVETLPLVPSEPQVVTPATPPPPYTPPVAPPVPPPPPKIVYEVIQPLPVQTIRTETVLSSQEIAYFWLDPWCSGDSTLEDPWGGPWPNSLLAEYDWGNSEHQIFLRLSGFTSNCPNKALLKLYCTGVDAWVFSPFDLEAVRLKQEWTAPPFEQPSWSAYCENDLPETEDTADTTIESEGANHWYVFDLTESYRAWQSGAKPNYGLFLYEYGWGDVWAFASPNHPDESLRPRIVTESGPTLELKLPLPGGKAWCLTTEAGGGDCASGWVDPYHTGNGFYSLDFCPLTLEDGKPKAKENVPILSAASGVVAEIGSNQSSDRGYYVVIRHEPSKVITEYLHLQSSPAFFVGQNVAQGDQIGSMGKSGISTGIHLHFGLKFNGQGGEGIPELSGVVLEGRLLQDFKIHCQGRDRLTYYVSSNLP